MEAYNFKEYFLASQIVNETFFNLEKVAIINEEIATVSKQKIQEAIDYGLKSMSMDFSFVIKFGASIGGLYQPLSKFYAGQGISFTEQELILLAGSLLGTLTKEDATKAKAAITKLLKGKNKAKKTVNIAIEIFKGLMKKLQGQQMVFAYAIMLVPIMEALEKIAGGNITAVNATTIKNIILGMSINFGIYAGSSKLKSIFNSLRAKINNKKE